MPLDNYLFPSERVELIRQGYDLRFASDFQRLELEDFTASTPKDDESLLRLVFVLPVTNKPYGAVDQNDKATLKALNKIRNDCCVYMDIHRDVVELHGRDVAHLSAGAQALRSLVEVNFRAPGCKMYPLIHRSPEVSHFSIFLQPTTELGYVQFTGGWRGVSKPQHTRNVEATRNVESCEPLEPGDLMQAIEVLGQSIRPVPGQLRMRIHFGVLNTRRIKKGVDHYSTTAHFVAFLNTVAELGTIHVHHRLGGPDLTLRIREQIYDTETKLTARKQKFTPDSATVLSLRDVKPKYCLVLFAGNRRIELDVQYDPDPSLPNLRPTAAAPRIFESAAKFKAAEVAVACPDQKFDWHLAIEGDIASEEHGTQEVRDLNTLAKSLEFSKRCDGSFEFPAFTVSSALLSTSKIDRVACKVTWAFEYVQRPLVLEASVYHDWQGFGRVCKGPNNGTLVFDTSQKPEPVKSCGISLYGREWDSKMQTIDPASSHFDQDFLAMFSDGPSDNVGGLLEEIDYLLDMLSREAR